MVVSRVLMLIKKYLKGPQGLPYYVPDRGVVVKPGISCWAPLFNILDSPQPHSQSINKTQYRMLQHAILMALEPIYSLYGHSAYEASASCFFLISMLDQVLFT